MYYLFSFVFFSCGVFLVFRPEFFIRLFLFMIVVIPSSNAYADIYYLYGFFAYDFFFVGLSLGFFLHLFAGKRLDFGGARIVLIFSLFFLVFYSLVYFSLNGSVDKYFLRDLKLAWILLIAVLFHVSVRTFKVSFSDKFVAIWVLVSAASSFFAAFAILFGFYKVDDAFYESNSFRYLSASTYIASIYIVYIWYKQGLSNGQVRLLEWIGFFASAAVLLLSGTRILLIAIFVSLAFATRMNLARFVYYFAFAAVNFLLFYFVSQALEVSRVTESMSADGALAQIASRIMPAFDAMNGMYIHEFILGKGFGYTFEIPWFEYRDLDSRNNFVDSFWATSVCKFGLFTFFYVYYFIKSATFLYPSRLYTAVTVFVCVVMLTFAVPYQGISIGLLVVAGVLGAISFNRATGLKG